VTKLSEKKSYDLVVIGSGPGGIHAAIQASKLGKKVAIIEKTVNKLGGAWIHTGTIPSKTLREALATVHSIKFHVGKDWVTRMVHDLSAQTLMGRAIQVADQEETVVRGYLERNGVDILVGCGTVEDEGHVRIISTQNTAEVIATESIIIATGSRPRRPDDIPFDGWRVVDSDEILKLKAVPEKMIIYGAGVIGCEYACIFNALGVDTTIIDARNVVMQTLDREITEELKSIMEEQGIKFQLGHTLESVTTKGPKVIADFSNDLKTESDVLFFAAGRVSNIESLGLDRHDIKTSARGAILVNEHYQTSKSNIYAVGDVIGAPALAATSAEQGRYAAAHAFNCRDRQFPETFPIGIYTIPELSSAGKTEEELKEEKIDYVVGRAGFKEIARGYIRGDTRGLVKILVSTKTHKILGIHIVGPDACNLIHTGVSVMVYDGHIQDLVDKMIFNYPTLSETYRVAAFNALNKIFPDGLFGNPPQQQKKEVA